LDNKEVMKTQEVFVPEAPPKVDARMIVRLMVFVVALINTVAAIFFDKDLNLSVDQAFWYEIFSAAFVIGSGFWATWKDNNITKKARIKAEVKNQVK
jgi:SPP1 family holin